ncbi:TPA: FliM/FliN family flagellar motor switch protein [Proteus mirabilis]
MSINLEVDNNHTDKNKINDIAILSSIFGTKKITEKQLYFVLKCENKLGTLTALVSVSQVMDNLYPEKKIDWELVPENYLISLFSQSLSTLLFPFSKEPMSLCVDNICLGAEKGSCYPSVDTTLGHVFICDIKWKYKWTVFPKNKIGFITSFILGYSKISLSLLKTILPGDILLIDDFYFSLNVGDRKYFYCSWDEGNCVTLDAIVQNNEGNEEDEQNDTIIEDSIDLAQSFDLNSIGAIPITISFLLANKTLSIDQLEELAPGKKFMLPDNAVRHINILANGKTIAQGELIKIKDMLAVEINKLSIKCE